MLSKVFIDDLKAMKILEFSDCFFFSFFFFSFFFCTAERRNAFIDFFPLQAVVILWHQLLFLSVDVISGLIATNFLGLLISELGNIFGIFLSLRVCRVIEIF